MNVRRFALSVLIVFALLFAAIILWRISGIVLLFIGSLAVAAATRAPIEGLMARRAPRAVAVLVVYLTILVVFGALGFFLYQSLGRELGSITEDLSAIYRNLAVRWGGDLASDLPALSARLPTPEQLGQLLAGDQLTALAQRLMGVTSGLSNFLTYAGIALVVSIYWIADRLRFERLLLSLLPATHRTRARTVWQRLEAGVGAYIRSEVAQGLIAGLLLAPVFALMDLRYPVFWALIGALTWFIPLVGALIFLIPLWLITWVQNGALIASAAVAYSIAVFALLELVVERRMVAPEGRNNILVLLVMLAMADALGLVGLLLAPPVAMAIHIFLTQLVTPAIVANDAEALAPSVEALEERLDEVRQVVEKLEAGSAPRLVNMTERMAELLRQARES
ncbi:MAG: AI-2E family transporter [Anaerolineae bacterium]|nr:AI-2E family transporter [Anaerolineae bacterium]